MAYGAVSVGVTATKILSTDVNRQSHLIGNNSATKVVYVGPDSSVTTANGFPLGPGNQLMEDKSQDGYWKGDIWGIAEAGTVDFRYWTREEKV